MNNELRATSHEIRDTIFEIRFTRYQIRFTPRLSHPDRFPHPLPLVSHPSPLTSHLLPLAHNPNQLISNLLPIASNHKACCYSWFQDILYPLHRYLLLSRPCRSLSWRSLWRSRFEFLLLRHLTFNQLFIFKFTNQQIPDFDVCRASH